MQRQDFNSNWLYSLGTGAALERLGKKKIAPVSVTLPHDAVILTPHNPNSANGSRTGFYDSFYVNYDKTFFIPREDEGKVILLEFGGVYSNASVYINDAFAGSHCYGYTKFFIDAAPFLKYGADNKIQVIVRNEENSSRWYTGGGIYRGVNILKSNTLYIKPQGVLITTEICNKEYAVVSITTKIESKAVCSKNFTLISEIVDYSGNIVADGKTIATSVGSETVTLRQKIVVNNPQLWNIDTPDLYSCRSKIVIDGDILDADENTFGIRSLQVDPMHGLQINGTSVKLRGGCIHHDNGIIGSVSLPAADERRIRKLKEAGYNAVRCSHNPSSDALLDACDKVGMLVMEEFTDVWTKAKTNNDYSHYFADNCEKDVASMVFNAYNHPSVIMYSIGNEIEEAGNPIDAKWGAKIADKICSLDSTRPTVNCANVMLLINDIVKIYMAKTLPKEELIKLQAGLTDVSEINTVLNALAPHFEKIKKLPEIDQRLEKVFSYVDIAGLNYTTFKYEDMVKKNPNIVIVGSETLLSELDANWLLVKKYPQILGDFVWTAWDYIGESGVGIVTYGDKRKAGVYSSDYCLTAGCGDLDLIGDRRPSSFWREIIWGLRKEPYIAVQRPDKYNETATETKWSWSDTIGGWSYPEYENKPVIVEVYSLSEEVELIVNGKSIGRKKLGEKKKCIAYFETVYVSGVITAIAYCGGKKISEFSLKTPEKDIIISAIPERTEIGRNDIVYIDISLVDKNGLLDISADKKIAVDVQGAGVLQGFGSADSYSTENFYDTQRTAYRGRLLAAVRSCNEIGKIKISLSANGLQTNNIEIDVK